MEFHQLLLMAAGAFTILAAISNWDWFIGHYRARLVVMLVGRNGARIFYGILGIVIIVVALRL